MIRAAGGVVARRRNGAVEVLVVHRPKYDDWSFPKGKALPGETDEDCAIREVEEETGLVCELGAELPATVYRDALGRPKRARYWLMTPKAGEVGFLHEVDDARWLTVEQASDLLTYVHDVGVLSALETSAVPG